MQMNENCLYCGKSLFGMCQLNTRKFCGVTCGNKYKLRFKKPDVQEKLWQHEPALFENAMEMYWSGVGSSAIARHLGISVGTMYSWVHDFGGQKERGSPWMPHHLMPLKDRFRFAEGAADWLSVLRESISENAEHTESPVIIICGFTQASCAGRLAGIVYEFLKQDPLNGKRYAFCSKTQRIITTISWEAPIYHVSKHINTSGAFIWPGEKLGASIEVAENEFEHLISLRKRGKNAENP